MTDTTIKKINKKPKKSFFKFMLGATLYTLTGVCAFGFIYISSKSNQDIEHYQKYTKTIVGEIERHELLKHQIAQGTISISKDEKVENKCSRGNSKAIKKCEEEQEEIRKKEASKKINEIISTKIFRNDEIIELDNAIIKNDTYSIITTFDFTKGNHLFSNPNQLCHLIKYLAPELKESIFTTVKFGDFLVKKNPKAMNEKHNDVVSKDCRTQETKIIIETKFYPKDLTASPTQTQLSVSPSPSTTSVDVKK